MSNLQRNSRTPRTLAVPAIIVLGGVAAFGIRSNAGQQAAKTPPIQPPAEVVNLQSAFEQVAAKMRPSIVFIQSRQTVKLPTSLQPGGGDDDNPMQFFFGPGMGQRGQQFRNFAPRRQATGSGVIVRQDGYILTNDHVVAGADKVTVKLQDGREFPGTVKRDFRSDLALVKIDATSLPAAELADSDKVKVGQWSLAFGAPFGLSDTMTAGIVSSLHRNQAIGSGTEARYYPSLVQTDASINPGNSGGPLVDIYGRVVGINVAIESPSGGSVGIGFAIPSNTAKYVMDQLIRSGKVTRGYMGLQPENLTYDQKRKYGVTGGALVRMVSDNSPASKAGVQAGDVVTRYNGKTIEDEFTFRDLVARTQPGQTVSVVVKRGDAEKTLNVTVETAKDAPVAQSEAPVRAIEPKGQIKKLGVQVANAADAEVRQQLNLKDDVKSGVVIVAVEPGSPASEAGIQPGDILTRLDGKSITTPDQVSGIVRGMRDGGSAEAVIRRGDSEVLVQLNLE